MELSASSDITCLKLSLEMLLEDARSLLTCTLDLENMEEVQDIVNMSKSVMSIGQACLERMTARISVSKPDGEECWVNIKATDTVACLKAKLEDEWSIPAYKQALVERSTGIGLTPGQQLCTLNLTMGIILVVKETPVDDVVLWVACQDCSDLCVNLASKAREKLVLADISNAGLIELNYSPNVCEMDGRSGLELFGSLALLLPGPILDGVNGPHAEGIVVGGRFTIAFWMWCPLAVVGPDMTSRNPFQIAPLLLYAAPMRGRLSTVGQILCDPAYLGSFDLSTLSPGWHHLCEVNNDNVATHYVDGQVVGTAVTQNYAQMHVTSLTCRSNSGSRTVVSDMCIFRTAATAEQVYALASGL
eukprot:TRINITY_DN24191_c0_g4_i1.p1 TRINITY_DN24191_c0_g4~~TRINITY_DN24191_c0_g4_i1.p1  ORF type:complete len:360 (-),score=68.48 TRINITY_DN24191_c0_g4_i1:16-1095(-)